MAGDLHCHSTCSDGSVKIERLAPMAADLGLRHLAVSDHDSVRSVRYAYAHPEQNGVRLIPATELTGYDFTRGRRVHLLCYWPDDCAALQAHCERVANRRNTAYLQSARELEQICPQFHLEHALAYAEDSGVLFKSGIMQALGELGLADGIYGERFQELFGREGKVRHSPGYEPVQQVLQTAKESRAVVVFAHPSVYKSMELVRELAAAGLIDGIEVEHPRNTEQDKAECRALCQRYGLIQTGGTDFHGSNTKRPLPLGTCVTADEQIERIQALAKRRKAE